VSLAAAREAPVLAECRREIRRLHGCAARFERFAIVPEAAGRARRVVAVFALEGHPAVQCFAWPEPRERGVAVVAVLRSIDIRGPEDAVRHVAELERTSQARWAQEYA
jgi:hypothetical protein